MPKQALLNYAWYIFITPQREGGRSCDQHVSHFHAWNDNEISSGWTTNWKQVYCNSREGVAGIFWCLMFFAELHGQNDCSECDSLHAIRKQGCCSRKVSHLCVYCSAAEEMALEQVDCFNYALARNDPRRLRELLLFNRDCPGTNLRTSRSFQKHPSLEHTSVWSLTAVVLQRSARVLQEPEAIGCFWNQLRHFCTGAIAGAYLILQQLEMHWNV